jgi:Flp pilus assembly protein TadG
MTGISMSALLRDKKGAGLIEVAAILPVLVLLFAGMIDVSRFVAAGIDVEQAAQRGTDYALALRPNGNNGDYIAEEVANAAGIPVEDVTVDIFLECDGVRQHDYYSACGPGEDQARFVGVTVVGRPEMLFNWPAFAGLFGKSALGSTIAVRGDSLVRIQ